MTENDLYKVKNLNTPRKQENYLLYCKDRTKKKKQCVINQESMNCRAWRFT